MDRALFIASAAAALVTPMPKPTPSAAPKGKSWDMCDTTTALPYDRPIDMSMETLDGPDFHLMDYRGRAVIMNIFTTWCGPCNEEQPYLVEFARKYEPQGLSVIAINDHELDDTVRRYRKKYEITYPIAMDRHGQFTEALENGSKRGTITYPTSIFISPTGYLYCYKVGDMSKAELEYRIQRFLAQTLPTAVPSGSATPAVSPSPTTGRHKNQISDSKNVEQ